MISDDMFAQMLDYMFLGELLNAFETKDFKGLGEFLKGFTDILEENGETLPEAVIETIKGLCDGVDPEELTERYGAELEELDKQIPDDSGSIISALKKDLEKNIKENEN